MKHTLALVTALAGLALTSFAEQVAPEIEPLTQELVPVLFERIDKNETIDVDLLCRALIGPQTTLRAYAATLLGDSGDTRAIPFLLDALSDESQHVGATYLDPGDATTRDRANKALKKLTGQDFGFVWSDPKDRRSEAIRRWSGWLKTTVDPQAFRDPDDLLWLLDRDRQALSVEYQRVLEALDAGKVPDTDTAEDVAVRFTRARGGLLAEEVPRVVGLLRMGRDVEFARAGDLVWVVRLSRLSLGVTQELWVGSATGEVRAMLPVAWK